MDDGGHHENGRHDPHQYKTPQAHQWLMQQQQPTMKQMMGIMAERDAAIQERNMAVSEKKAAMAERDVAYLQRDKAIQERNAAVMERDSVVASCHANHHHHHHHHLQVSQLQYQCREMQVAEAVPISTEVPSERRKRKGSQKKKGMKMIVGEWRGEGELREKQVVMGLDESMMVPPVCTCTGVMRQCYKWGNGGWQSSCCTTSISLYPLPPMPNKRHTRIGGRKMSGSAFTKLLTRLTAAGFDLSSPLDLKHHWAKHGTNRYITIK